MEERLPFSGSLFFILIIEDVGFGGKGVGRQDGKVVFVPFTIPGEQVSVRITREKKSFAEAELISIETSSAHRVEPRCPYFQECGGCAYQHIDYLLQLKLKSTQVEQTLRRVGGINPVPMQPIIAAPEPYGYRSRLRVHVQDGVTGFYAYGSHDLVDIEYCPISSENVNAMLAKFREKPRRDGDYTLSESGRGRFFEQANPQVAELMLELVGKLVAPYQELLIDAYCGAGLFAKFLSKHFPRVIGIESNQHAVEVARASAGANEEYLAGDVAAHISGVLQANQPGKTTLLVDPPAIGLSAQVAQAILSGAPAELIYVSCNPATLARDLKFLATQYELLSVTPLDMFAQTAEIEVVTHLRRKQAS